MGQISVKTYAANESLLNDNQHSSLTDKAKALIDGNMVLVTKAGDRNIDLRCGHAGFGGFIGPDLPGRLACFYCRLPLTTVESD